MEKVINTVNFRDNEFKLSSYTGIDRYACVMVARRPDVIGVRHSRDAGKTTLEFTPDEWKAFIQGVKDGEFDI
jgi:hypothetical protein